MLNLSGHDSQLRRETNMAKVKRKRKATARKKVVVVEISSPALIKANAMVVKIQKQADVAAQISAAAARKKPQQPRPPGKRVRTWRGPR